MTRVLSLFIGSFLIASASYAQILVGPVAGGGVSWVSFHEPESRQSYKQVPVPTFHAGVALSFQVRKNFYLHTSLLYSRKGENLSSTSDPDLSHKEIYHFIDMPMIFTYEFKINLGHNRVVKWYAGLGPNVSYWLDGRGTIMNNDLAENGIPPIDYKISFTPTSNPDPSKVYVTDANRSQIGLAFASGWAFEPAGGPKFYLDFRYEIGHSYMSKSGYESLPHDVVSYHGDMKARMMAFKISFSYLIDLKTAERKKGKSTSGLMKKRK